MADTGENRQTVGRATAKEAETVRAAKKVVSEERSTAKISNAVFHNSAKGSQRKSKANQQRNSDPKASKR
ncbi:MAG: hypothetical protein ABSG11_24385 [Candidatus Korobacteraceae bacterium]|jgi:hypothetical protein